MLSATELYTRNGALIVTHWPFSYSSVGISTEPAGPLPLIPNRLWFCAARSLWPQPDSSIACAIVTAAGMPYWRWAAIAPGATRWMKACWAVEPVACGLLAATGLLLYRCFAEPGDPPVLDCAPGMAAAPSRTGWVAGAGPDCGPASGAPAAAGPPGATMPGMSASPWPP